MNKRFYLKRNSSAFNTLNPAAAQDVTENDQDSKTQLNSTIQVMYECDLSNLVSPVTT